MAISLARCRDVVMYPRKEFFDRAVCVMQRSNRFVPFFNDKHLSYRADFAKEMFDVARSCGVPLMAGSSVPLAQRSPALDLPPHADIAEAVAIHGGGIEVYDFHGLELLQSFVEARRGGETGISSVEFLTGDELAGADSRHARSEKLRTGRRVIAEACVGRESLKTAGFIVREPSYCPARTPSRQATSRGSWAWTE